ncbi:MAG: putative tRNA pseudouridine synthase D [Promethearchaeota archaeon]|nr:MAG: putative tRNA pseudouridine synthase D [Candidatus Lokiarchaeota archaeon]
MDYNYKFPHNNEREVERFVGIKSFSTSQIEGIGGIYKDSYKDFIVKEITETGKILELKEDREPTPFLNKRDNYTTFNLIKVNKDTFSALDDLCKGLGISKWHISYSGLKDKNSISVQKVSIQGNHIKALRALKLKDIFIRSIAPTRRAVMLGSNRGNNFVITIRNVENHPNLKEKIHQLLDQLKSKGFPNYFGLQRFGTYRPNSHLIGRYLLEGDFKKAFREFVCTTYSTEMKSLSKIRKNIGNSLNNIKKLKVAYKSFPKGLSYECQLIEHIMAHPGDFQGAFGNLSEEIINLIINAFQSYLFNKLISLRAERGISLFKPVKGDVISILDDINGHTTNATYLYGGPYDPYLEEAMKCNRGAIIVPMIGYDTDLNEFPLMKTLFEQIKREEQLNEEIFDSTLLNKFNLKGSFRAMMTNPIGLQLVDVSGDERYKGKRKLKIEFSLNKGCYATMLLRELIK